MLKRVNEARILHMIRHETDISRVEIAKKAKMSKAGVSEIIARLINAKFILEKGKGISTNRGGKRPTILEINPAGGFVFGIHIERHRCNVVIADIKGEFICQEALKYPISEAIDSALPEICNFMEELMVRQKLDPKRLISIAIATPGLVDRQKGDLIIAHTEGWAHKPFIEVFQEHFNVPVILENDVNALTLAEYHFGMGKEHTDLVCLHFADGIGAGLIENQELVTGIYGGAGEVGYMRFTPCKNGDISLFFNNGQKHYGKILGIINLASSLNYACEKMDYQLNVPISELNFHEFLQSADTGHAAINEYFRQFADIVSDLCADMIIMLNPGIFVLSGEIFHCSDKLNDMVLDKTRHILDETPLKNMTQVQIGALSNQDILKGVIEIALSVLYKADFNQKQ